MDIKQLTEYWREYRVQQACNPIVPSFVGFMDWLFDKVNSEK